jgi:hypothetical protein
LASVTKPSVLFALSVDPESSVHRSTSRVLALGLWLLPSDLHPSPLLTSDIQLLTSDFVRPYQRPLDGWGDSCPRNGPRPRSRHSAENCNRSGRSNRCRSGPMTRYRFGARSSSRNSVPSWCCTCVLTRTRPSHRNSRRSCCRNGSRTCACTSPCNSTRSCRRSGAGSSLRIRPTNSSRPGRRYRAGRAFARPARLLSLPAVYSRFPTLDSPFSRASAPPPPSSPPGIPAYRDGGSRCRMVPACHGCLLRPSSPSSCRPLTPTGQRAPGPALTQGSAILESPKGATRAQGEE